VYGEKVRSFLDLFHVKNNDEKAFCALFFIATVMSLSVEKPSKFTEKNNMGKLMWSDSSICVAHNEDRNWTVKLRMLEHNETLPTNITESFHQIFIKILQIVGMLVSTVWKYLYPTLKRMNGNAYNSITCV